MLVSVVVPTRDRPALIARCLDSLVRQDFDPTAYEVIVVDDGASEAVREAVERVGARSAATVRYVAGEGRGPATARNLGWRAACGEIVAFTDDDCVPARSWLRAGRDAFLDGVESAWGQVIVPVPNPPTDYQRDAAGLASGNFVTANCFCRRDVLVQAGGFDERFTFPWREDSDLFFTLVERNTSLVYAPGALVIHPIRPAPWGVSLRQQRKSMFNALLYRKHPQLYRDLIQPRPPLWYYGIVSALVAGCLAAVAGFPSIAAALVTAWLVMTAVFCARRLHRTSHTPTHVAEMVVTSALIPWLSVFWRLRGALKYRVVFL